MFGAILLTNISAPAGGGGEGTKGRGGVSRKGACVARVTAVTSMWLNTCSQYLAAFVHIPQRLL